MRSLTTFIAGTIAFFGVVLLAVVAWTGWNANVTAVERERTLVENAVDQGISRVLSEQKSVAWWDDAVINVASGRVNVEWADVQLGMYLSETYGHAEIYVLDSENRPLWSWVDGANAGPDAYQRRADYLAPLLTEVRTGQQQYERQREQDFEAAQAAYRDLLGAHVARWGGHLLAVGGRPVVVGAMPIVPNIDQNLVPQTPYLLVSIAPVDEAFIGTIGATLLMEDLSVTAEPLADGAHAIQPFVTDDGQNVGYMNWTPRRPGQRLLTMILPLVALGVVGVGLLAGVMFSRLKRASSELANREQLALHQAKHDALSGLPNRRHFVDTLQMHLDGMVQARNNGRIIVAYIDVDRFKDINDTMGHQAGDTLIMGVAARLQQALAPDDFLARFGGDEFAVLRLATREEAAADLAERLRMAFDEHFDVWGQHVRMTASIGISMAPDHGVSPQELMRHADIALYQGKNQGRDRAMFFCAEMAAEVEQRREVELELHAALQAGELMLHYQPVVSCADGRVKGLEALLRWRHATKGDISPGVFVPIAEEAGLMPALGAYVLNKAFEEARNWPDLEVSINLSPVQFRHVDLVELLEQLLVKHGVEASRIVLEVTEGVLMESTDRNRAILEAVRAMGFKIALDDFGTGYSSLRYLSDFRFDKIKIDRAFVTDIQERKRALTIIQSVVTLGRGLGMQIVAEGVETEAEASVMRLVGVNELQGFFFSPAVPPAQVGALRAAIGAPRAVEQSALADLRARHGA
ncbi:MAG TPA: EAL domain-containing protein [Terricaulis sp.]|nr:EAL domain-containing protein [Terricaulis sp.]